jgi:hypothetical protein
MEDNAPPPRVRGKGRGSSFFALGRDIWERLQIAETSNRMNLILTYLVLLAGTGSDHRLTKWSAKACEQYTGVGKPRARHAITELVAAGLVEHTDTSTQMKPQYRLPELPREAEPIFLPMQLVTGLADETPILQRVRETGDALALIMLIDLYGEVQLDATYGIPLGKLSEGMADASPPRKLREVGVHTIWSLHAGTAFTASGNWTTKHRIPIEDNVAAWQPFWERLTTLKNIGALWYEPWVFDGPDADAEPLLPVDPGVFFSFTPADDEAKLTLSAYQAAQALIKDEGYLLDHYEADVVLPLPAHFRPPALRSVARLRVEPDTPARRLSYRHRRLLIERFQQAFDQLIQDAEASRFNRPMRSRIVSDPPVGPSVG